MCECENGADTEKRNEETERKSGVIVIKARPQMKGRNAWEAEGGHSRGAVAAI